MENELDEISNIAIKVCSFISVTKDACQINDYLYEEMALEQAKKLQTEVIDRIDVLRINCINVFKDFS